MPAANLAMQQQMHCILDGPRWFTKLLRYLLGSGTVGMTGLVAAAEGLSPRDAARPLLRLRLALRLRLRSRLRLRPRPLERCLPGDGERLGLSEEEEEVLEALWLRRRLEPLLLPFISARFACQLCYKLSERKISASRTCGCASKRLPGLLDWSSYSLETRNN